MHLKSNHNIMKLRIFLAIVALSSSSCIATFQDDARAVVTEWSLKRSSVLIAAGIASLIAGFIVARAALKSSRTYRKQGVAATFYLRYMGVKIGVGLILCSVIAGTYALQDFALYQRISDDGVEVKVAGKTKQFVWADFSTCYGKINSSRFELLFGNNSGKCNLKFDQAQIGAKNQDRAIEITQSALRKRGLTSQF